MHFQVSDSDLAKDSRTTAFMWRKKLSKIAIQAIQDSCTDAMESLGYNPMTNLSVQKEDENFPIIVKSHEEIWPEL